MTRRAFTLLELLLATVLSTMLMLGVLAVVARLGATSVAATEAGVLKVDAGPTNHCIALLRDDLRHAMSVTYSARGDAMFINGYSDLGDASRSLKHHPVQIIYRLEKVNGRIWLVRIQRRLDVLTNQATDRELVACGINRFAVTASGRDGAGESFGVIGASGTDFADRRVAADSGLATASDRAAPLPEDPYESIFLARFGNFFYRRYIPEWVGYRGGESDAASTGPSLRSAGGVGSPSPPITVAEQLADRPASQTAWRLRIWADDANQPSVDRLIAFVTGGGQ